VTGPKSSGEGSAQAGPSFGSGSALGQVHPYRSAARKILRSGDAHRESALLHLYERAKKEPYADFVIKAIVAEIGWESDRWDLEHRPRMVDAFVERHRQLRARGWEKCQTCLTPLSTRADWLYWAELEDEAGAQIAARERAV
jgi:hypothetical protein